ncbi:aspartate 1-decarboxylase [Moorena sp. SIO3H5]|uniref:aspartate 1-decarboxylase n=1 Tax=Moorena sp. SIO3H5 TaxID=2607834 RepID=UPI0013B6C4E6|nr:aspartate 1-decarboxylase [Moorena sp. SIO3H5]NEO68284.1 aspartate 1-decarboxylase [Moorena sp. SIO3H5]
MLITTLKSKLHRVKVTEAQLYYEGSITIDEELLKIAHILPHEKVQIVNVNNGARLETYTIPGEWGSRTICLNGPAARMNEVGDEIIIITYAQMTEEEALLYHPKVIMVNEKNNPMT